MCKHVALQRWVIVALCFMSCTAQDIKRTPLKMRHRQLINFLFCEIALLPFLTEWHHLAEQGILAAAPALQSSALANRSWEELFQGSDSAWTAWILKLGRPNILGAQPGRGEAPPGLVSFLEAKHSEADPSSKCICWKDEETVKSWKENQQLKYKCARKDAGLNCS